jgi:hypothetical protein
MTWFASSLASSRDPRAPSAARGLPMASRRLRKLTDVHGREA